MAQKGFPFEREISKDLSLWVTDGESDGVIWRTSQSGGRATSRSFKGLSTAYQYGDLTFTDPIAQPFFDFFVVELKRGYNKNMDVLDWIDKPLRLKPSIIFEWWEKLLKTNELAMKMHPLIIFKRDGRNKCVIVSSDLFSYWEDWAGIYRDPFLEFKGKYRLVVTLFQDFFEWMTFEDIKNITKELK